MLPATSLTLPTGNHLLQPDARNGRLSAQVLGTQFFLYNHVVPFHNARPFQNQIEIP